jgi:lysozyme family protein
MNSNWDNALAAVLHHEGSFVHHKDDPGGMTNLGCTKAVWEEWCGHPVTEQDMRDLQPSDVAPLYKSKYWDRVKGDDLPSGVDYIVFDAAINSGAGRAAKWLQECVGTQPDGAIGPMSLQAARSMVAADLINLYCNKRLAFLKELKTWDVFGKGWERRVEDVRSAALKMI